LTYLGKNLRYLRAESKLSRGDLALQIQIWEDQLRKIEQGKEEPNLQTLVNISQYFRRPLEHLLLRDLEIQAARIESRKIKLVLLDVDGTLTDGGLYYGEDGKQQKRFHVKDGMMIHRLITRYGMQFGLISGGDAPGIVERRAQILGIQRVYVGKRPKVEVTQEWLTEMNLKLENLVFLGDDVNDLPLLRMAGISACPADAPAAVKREVQLILNTPGGQGCVRELMEDLLGYNIVE
jgi:3-deoxy-D-manno-octulosonate 8-phosphate phosphatase (KDO 8-P phosphatase)